MRDRAAFVGLLLLALVPVWVVEALPTTDGPCHVYNAWVLRNLDSPRHPILREHYEIDRRPLPNWLGHALLAGLMAVVEPRAAEKVLASGYLVLFLAGARLLAGAVDRERRWLGLLAFPLAFNQLFQMGFYNFSLGLALWMVAVAWWWRRRADPGLAFGLGLNALLLLLYFAHLLPLLLALGTIGVLWLATLRRSTFRRHLLHLAILAPQAVLPLWYVASTGTRVTPSTTIWAHAARYFGELRVLLAFGRPQLWLGRIVACLFLALLVVTLWRRLSRRREGLGPAIDESDAFLLLALLATVLYFVAPEGVGGGTLLRNRLSLFPWLLLLPWLAPRLGKGLERALVAGLAALAIAEVGYLADRFRAVEAEVREFLVATEAIAPGSRVLPLLFDRRPRHAHLGLLGHAISYAAIDKGLIDWDNYEAANGQFPVRFREGLERPEIYGLEAAPGSVDLSAHEDSVDFVFCWKMPEDAPVARQLASRYRLVADEGPARVYERRADSGEGQATYTPREWKPSPSGRR